MIRGSQPDPYSWGEGGFLKSIKSYPLEAGQSVQRQINDNRVDAPEDEIPEPLDQVSRLSAKRKPNLTPPPLMPGGFDLQISIMMGTHAHGE